MTLTISLADDGSYTVALVDEKTSICGKDENNQPRFGVEIKLTGKVRGTVLNAQSTSMICQTTPQTTLEYMLWIDFTYQAGSDTLRDSAHLTNWKRVNSP